MLDKLDNISDNHLISMIRDDHRDAFKALFDRYSKKLYYFSLKYLYSKEESEDLVQSVFISIWEHRKSYDAIKSVKDYLYKSAINIIYNYLKKKATHAKFVESEMTKDETYSNLAYDQVYFNDLERLLKAIIENLPPQQKKAFKLSRFEGLTYEEISKRLNLSVRTVENHVFRALKIIKDKFKDSI